MPHFNHHSNRRYKGKGKPVDSILPKKLLNKVINTTDVERSKPSALSIVAMNANIAKQQMEQQMRAFYGLGISFKTRAMRTVGVTYRPAAGGGAREVARRAKQIAKGQLKLGHN